MIISTLESGTKAGLMSSAVETSNLTVWPGSVFTDSESSEARAVVTIPSDGSRPITFVKYWASLKVAIPGPQPRSTTVSSFPPVEVWCERMLSYKASL